MQSSQLRGTPPSHLHEGIASCFLDLSQDRPDSEQNGQPYDPNGDHGLLVEWSVPAEVRDDVIHETRLLLVGGSSGAEDVADADAVTEADLPS